MDFSKGNLTCYKRDYKRKAPEENGDTVDAAQQDPIDPNLEQASGFTAVNSNSSLRNEDRPLPTASALRWYRSLGEAVARNPAPSGCR
jgi:hypothetical protein